MMRRTLPLTLVLLFTGCDLFGGDSGTGNKRTFDITYQNLGTETVHIDFAGRTQGPTNSLEPQASRVDSTTATIGEFLQFEAGINQVALGEAECQLTVRDPVAARVIWAPPNLTCAGFDGSPAPGGTDGSTGSGGSSSAGSSTSG